MSRPIVYVFGIIILVILLCLPPPAHSANECVFVTAPALNSVVISKTPEIKAEFRCAIKAESLVVIFDAVDVTQILNKTEKGFSYLPETMTAIGNHTLKISYLAADGTQKQQELTFISRHSKALGEAYSKNNATLIYTGAVVQTISATEAAVPFDTNTQGTQPAVAPSTTAAIPRSKFEANLISENKLREDNRGDNTDHHCSLSGAGYRRDGSFEKRIYRGQLAFDW